MENFGKNEVFQILYFFVPWCSQVTYETKSEKVEHNIVLIQKYWDFREIQAKKVHESGKIQLCKNRQ